HGYMRSGFGYSKGGGGQSCFSPANSDFGKYRLGNECDTYAEMGLSETFQDGTSEADPKYGAHLRLSVSSPAFRDYEGPDVSQVALREAYVDATNVAPMSAKL